jgi:hypothetical protein
VGSNKEFKNIFNECLEHLLTGQETVEQCLRRYPGYAAELEPLLRTAILMNKATDVKPSAEFRAKARYQMQLKMAQAKAPQRMKRTVPRWAIAVGTVMLVFLLGGSTVLASQNSMPGNPLYAVKLATENLQVKLAGSEEKKTELYMAMADKRIAEMAWMVDNGKTQDVEAAAKRLNDYYAEINGLTQAASTETAFSPAAGSTYQSNTALAVMTPATTAAQTTVPVAVAAPTPPVTGATDKNSATTTMVVTLPQVTLPGNTVIITTGGNANNRTGNQVNTTANANLSAQDANLVNILIYNANTQPEQIQKLLDSNKVPESAKPALRRALAAAIAVYQNAISNLNH